MQAKLFKSSTLYSALSETAAQRKDAVSLVYGDEKISYSDLIQKVDATACYLAGLGLKKGDAVAAFSQNCPEFVIYFYASAKLGLVFVPLNFNLTAVEVAYILKHCEARYLFWDSAAANSLTLELPDLKCQGLVVPAQITDQIQPALSDNDADVDLMIAYTSGTTGTPKAVAISHRATLGAAASLMEFWGLNSQDTTIVAAPLGFLLGLSTATTVSLLAGMKVVMNRRFHPGEVLDAMIEHGATVYNGVPTMYTMMLEYSEQQDQKYDLSGMRSLICSGAPMPDELLKRFEQRFGHALQNYYGMTEAYPLIGKYSADEGPYPKGAVGRLAPSAKLQVTAADGGECPVGVEGELLVLAPSTLTRYHKDAVLTASAFKNGWFSTGDLGYIDSNGYVFITGRIKDIIIKGGANISPVEVEGALLQHPDIQSVAVIGVPDKTYGEVPVAFAVKRRGAAVSAEELIEFSAGILAKFKVPATVYYVADLPLGKTGKVDKAALKKQWEADSTK